MRKPNTIGVALAVIVILECSVFAAGALPPTLMIRGHHLVLNGEAVRSELLGIVELYRIGLYLSTRGAARAGVRDDAPKALRLEILLDTNGARIPSEWRRELEPILTQQQQQSLRAAYSRLQAGDTLTISYTPRDGTHVVVNAHTVLESKGRDLIDAFLDQWLGQHPVSEEIKSALLRQPG
jgi:hypothetical protein